MVVVIHIGGSVVSMRPRASWQFTESKGMMDGGADGDDASQ